MTGIWDFYENMNIS